MEQAQLYAKAGIWNETLALVSALRAAEHREGTELLQSVELIRDRIGSVSKVKGLIDLTIS